MSELTKIAAILFKNLSDALLTTASELSKLDAPQTTAKIFTQADDNPPLLEPEKTELTTLYLYDARQKVIVMFDGSMTPTKCRVLKRLDKETYLVYPQRSPKSTAIKITYSQILGLDPDR